MKAVGLLHVLAGATVLVAAGLISGHFGIFFDTGGYVRQGEYMADRLFHIERVGFYPMMSIIPGEINKDVRHLLSVIDARSPSYSLFLYLGAKIGGFAFVAWLQALAAAWVIGLSARVTLPERRWTAFWIVITVLAGGSSLPFFADFAMPDAFSGIAILCMALLLAASDELGWGEKLGVWALMTASISFHRSNLAVAAALVVTGTLLLMIAGRPKRPLLLSGAAVVAALGLIVAGGAAYKSMLERDMGIRSGSPPFLMARILADGVGRDYLAKNCPGGVAPTLCPFRDQALDDANVILWNLDPGVGVFNASKYEMRLKLIDEEKPFVVAAVLAEPIRFAWLALRHFAKQLVMFAVDESLEQPGRYIAGKYPDLPTVDLLLPGTKACATFESCPQGAMGTILEVWHGLVLALSLVTIGGTAFALNPWRFDTRCDLAGLRPRVSTLRAAAAIILLGILVNAGACGILSEPVLRYQARVIWLLPMMAAFGALFVNFRLRYRRQDDAVVPTRRAHAATSELSPKTL